MDPKIKSKSTTEFIELEVTASNSGRDSLDGGNNEVTSSSMNRAKWLACLALAMSYTTAIQQQMSTASVVKHIDAALGTKKPQATT
jgi:hypothetical protein